MYGAWAAYRVSSFFFFFMQQHGIFACLLAHLRLRFEIVRGAQAPSQRHDIKYCITSTSASHLHLHHIIIRYCPSRPKTVLGRKAATHLHLVLAAKRCTCFSVFPPARPTSGSHVKLCRPVPPVFRLFVSVSEGTGAKEVITARSR